MSVNSFEELLRHVGHNIEVVTYDNEDGSPENVSIECNDCNEVLMDFNQDSPSEVIENEKVWSTYFCVEDILSCMDEEVRRKFDELSVDKKREIFRKHEREIKGGMEAGMMHDWTGVVSDIIYDTGIKDEIEDAHRRRTGGEFEL